MWSTARPPIHYSFRVAYATVSQCFGNLYLVLTVIIKLFIMTQSSSLNRVQWHLDELFVIHEKHSVKCTMKGDIFKQLGLKGSLRAVILSSSFCTFQCLIVVSA